MAKGVKMKPVGVIKARLGIEPNGRVQKFFTNACYKHMDKYVPMDEGNLRTNVSIEGNLIIYESPYASYQYYGKRKDKTYVVKNYTTPGTGPYWNKRMWSAEKEDVIKETQNYVNRGGK